MRCNIATDTPLWYPTGIALHLLIFGVPKLGIKDQMSRYNTAYFRIPYIANNILIALQQQYINIHNKPHHIRTKCPDRSDFQVARPTRLISYPVLTSYICYVSYKLYCCHPPTPGCHRSDAKEVVIIYCGETT